ncbi:MAG: response regulator [Bacteroidota bacterium]
MENGDFGVIRAGTILLAEDDEAMRGLVQLVLEARGFRVLAVSNGSEALQAYTKFGNSVEMVISDVGMPGMSGVDLFREIALINPIVKMILISGHIDSTSLGQLRKVGLRHFIQKPFSPDQFLQVIDKVLAEP